MSHATGPPSWFTRCDQDLAAIVRFAAAFVRRLSGRPDPPDHYHNVREHPRRRRRRRRLVIVQEVLEEEESDTCRAAAVALHPSAPVVSSPPPRPAAPVPGSRCWRSYSWSSNLVC